MRRLLEFLCRDIFIEIEFFHAFINYEFLGITFRALKSACMSLLMVFYLISCIFIYFVIPSWSYNSMKSFLQKNANVVSSTSKFSSMTSHFPDRFSVAPMMDYTNRHQRKLQRWLTKHTTLYTEMVVATTIIYTKQLDRHLEADFTLEEPLVLQLGGSIPSQMKEAAKIAYDYGYRQFNLNVGCPSDTVADNGCFGAALMLKPDLVSELVLAIQESLPTPLPVTVKCRLAVNNEESYEFLYNFVETVSTKGKIKHFIVHARNAILGGKFSPDQNRKIPPLKYHYVYRLMNDFPHLYFTLNGGLQTYEEIEDKLVPLDSNLGNLQNKVHGVMVGRSIINQPFYWRNIDSRIYSSVDPGMVLLRFCYFV